MGTLGMVTVQKSGKVIMKVVCGSDGYKAQELARRMMDAWPMTVDAVYDLAREVGFGSTKCLVVMTNDAVCFNGDEDLDPLYRATFEQPHFNPRWPQGICDHTAVVNVENIRRT